MSSATHEPLGKRWATGENPPPCTVCERRQPSSRASNIKRVTSLAARVAQPRGTASVGKASAAAPISTTAAQEWFENAANEQEKKLDDRLKEFGHSIKKALTTLRQEQAEELYTSKASTVEEVKSISEALRSIQERQSALEAKLANMMQQTALRAAGVASSGTGGRLFSSASPPRHHQQDQSHRALTRRTSRRTAGIPQVLQPPPQMWRPPRRARPSPPPRRPRPLLTRCLARLRLP